MMKSLIFFSSFVVAVFGAPPAIPQEYPTPSPTQEYNPDIGQTNVGGYGVNKDPYCHKVEKVAFENQCEPYKEKTCWTQNKEICEPKFFKNCTGVIVTNIERCGRTKLSLRAKEDMQAWNEDSSRESEEVQLH